MLTAAAVQRLKPGPKVREIPDRDGLRLVIQPSGSKSWAMRFRRPDGRPGNLTLGRCDLSTRAEPALGRPLTLAGARQLAAEINRKRAAGVDVITEKQQARTTNTDATFTAVALRFVEEHAKRQNRTWAATARFFGIVYDPAPIVLPGSLCDVWRGRSLTDITEDDVYRVIDQCATRGVPGWRSRRKGESPAVAWAMHAALGKFFNWARAKRLIRTNPIEGIAKPRASRPRDRVLTNNEIARFWRACESVNEPFGSLCQTLLLTGQRLGEVSRMTRLEISADGATWNIPGERTKNGRPHSVPLSSLAKDVLARVKHIDRSLGYVFTTNGRTPVSGFSKVKSRLDAALGDVPEFVMHDLRRTCATGMAELGIAPHIVEAVLNHVSGHRAGVAGVYNRAVYGEEKRAALERWANHIEKLVRL
jgi:integrase